MKRMTGPEYEEHRREDGSWAWLGALIVVLPWVALCCLALLLCGCGPRLSDGQAQALADARAGAEVFPEQPSEEAHAVGAGVSGFVLAATENLEGLPEPTAAPAEIIAAPKPYAEAGKHAAANPPKGWGAGVWALIGSGTVAVIGFGLRLARNVPGVGGVVAGILSPLWDRFVPDKVRAREQQVDQVANRAMRYADELALIATAAGLGEQVERAKARAADVAEQLGVKEEIDRRLREIRGQHGS